MLAESRSDSRREAHCFLPLVAWTVTGDAKGKRPAEGPEGCAGKRVRNGVFGGGDEALFASVSIFVYLIKFLLQEFSFLLQV